MKKSSLKRLSLTTQTIKQLTDSQLLQVAGGGTPVSVTHRTCACETMWCPIKA
jgi:hypothetical protein